MKSSLIIGMFACQIMLFSAESNPIKPNSAELSSAELSKRIQMAQDGVEEEEEEELIVFEEDDFSSDDFLE